MSSNLIQDLKDIFGLTSQTIENLKTGRQEIISKPFYFIMRPIIDLKKNIKEKHLSTEGINNYIYSKINKIIDNTNIIKIEGEFIKNDYNQLGGTNSIIDRLKEMINATYNRRCLVNNTNNHGKKLLNTINISINRNWNTLYNCIIKCSKYNITQQKFNVYKSDIETLYTEICTKNIMAKKKEANLEIIEELWDKILYIPKSSPPTIKYNNIGKPLSMSDFYLMPFIIFRIKDPVESVNSIIEKFKKSDIDNEFAYSTVSIKPQLTIKVPPINVTNVPIFTVQISFEHLIKAICIKYNNDTTKITSYISDNQNIFQTIIPQYTKKYKNKIQTYITFTGKLLDKNKYYKVTFEDNKYKIIEYGALPDEFTCYTNFNIVCTDTTAPPVTAASTSPAIPSLATVTAASTSPAIQSLATVPSLTPVTSASTSPAITSLVTVPSLPTLPSLPTITSPVSSGKIESVIDSFKTRELEFKTRKLEFNNIFEHLKKNTGVVGRQEVRQLFDLVNEIPWALGWEMNNTQKDKLIKQLNKITDLILKIEIKYSTQYPWNENCCNTILSDLGIAVYNLGLSIDPKTSSTPIAP